MLRDHGRFRYSAIVDRPDWSWPDGRRLAVYVALNLEHFAYGEGLGLSYSPGSPTPTPTTGRGASMAIAWASGGSSSCSTGSSCPLAAPQFRGL